MGGCRRLRGAATGVQYSVQTFAVPLTPPESEAMSSKANQLVVTLDMGYYLSKVSNLPYNVGHRPGCTPTTLPNPTTGEQRGRYFTE